MSSIPEIVHLNTVFSLQDSPTASGSIISLSSPSFLQLFRKREESPSSTFQRDIRGIFPPSITDTNIKLPGGTRSRVYTVKYNLDGSLLAVAEQSDNIFVLDTSRGCKLQTNFNPHVYWAVTELGWVNNSTLLYSTLNSTLHLVKLCLEGEGRDAPTQIPLSVTWGQVNGRYSRDAAVYSFAVAPGGNEIVAAMSDGRLVLFSLETNQPVATWTGHKDDINSVCYLSGEGGAADVICSASDDGLVLLSDRREANKIAGCLPGHLCGISSVSSRGCGNYICSNGKDQTVKVWDVRKAESPSQRRQPLFPLTPFLFDYRHAESLPYIIYHTKHPHDASVATLRGSTVLSTLIRARFSPLDSTGGRFVAAGSFDGAINIWDLSENGTCMPKTSLNPHGALVRDVSWHPGGSHLASGGFDGRVVISVPRGGEMRKRQKYMRLVMKQKLLLGLRSRESFYKDGFMAARLRLDQFDEKQRLEELNFDISLEDDEDCEAGEDAEMEEEEEEEEE